jgi:dolichol-phosphate mannosyltransferase
LLTIVVPAYKEAQNLPRLAERLHRVMTREGLAYELLIVDDDSPDDTVDVARQLSASYPLRLIQRHDRPRDLSLSVVAGIREAGHERILVMDADLSHPPEQIPAMLETLARNPTAFVIGSRYIEGGSFDRDWSLWRFINSTAATLLARPLVSCADPMSGFFLFDINHAGDLTRLRPIGYKIGLELMVRGRFESIMEVPISFMDREVGASKMNFKQQLKYIRHLSRLYLYRFGGVAEFIHFGLVGASGFVIDVVFYYLFQGLGLGHQLSRGLSFWPAVSWNWLINRTTTFGGRQRRPKARQWLEFVGLSLLGFSINWGTYVALTSNFAFFDHYRMLALVIGVVGASIFNFTMSTSIVYSELRR